MEKMKMNVNELLLHSFVISVDPKRYDTFCSRFIEHNLLQIPKKFTGFQIKNGIYKECGLIKSNNICNCFLSHIALVKIAQALDWDFIGIFEDDALPCEDCYKKLEDILSALPENIDLLKLGHLGSLKTPISVNNIFEIAQTYGSHSYIVFKKYYSKYIELTQKDILVDRLAMNASSGNIVYAVKELLFIQDDRDFQYTLHNNKNFFNSLVRSKKLTHFKI